MRAVVYAVLSLSLLGAVSLHLLTAPSHASRAQTDAAEEAWRSQIAGLDRQIQAAEDAGNALEVAGLQARKRPLVRAWQEYQAGARVADESWREVLEGAATSRP